MKSFNLESSPGGRDDLQGPWLSENYTGKESCGKTIGTKSNINLEDCTRQDVETCETAQNSTDCINKLVPTGILKTYWEREYRSGQRLGKCDFTFKDADGTLWDECRLQSEEGYAYNIYTCRVSRPFFDYLNQFAFFRTRLGIDLRVPTTARESIQTL